MVEIAIHGLHHNAYRCRDAEETRCFYEDFLGLPLAEAFEITTTQTGRSTNVLHIFFEMADGSFLAFFDAPNQPFEFKAQHDFDLHIALKVEMAHLHGFIHSIYFRDPNGYVVELTTPMREDNVAQRIETAARGRAALADWNAAKPSNIQI